MYIAMNRFRVETGREEEFEQVWRERESYLDQVEGFREFHLLRGSTDSSSDAKWTLYVSHSVWESGEAFDTWTRSEAFRKGHGGARSPSGIVLGHPNFEGFKVVL